ncbi:aryl-alcohol dehydrogenase-like predicted oxidoreductase [Pedobacter cryoconitis]|uniref:Aryl-alcohol dehydrogenase-like predicted oxidoreductase n=1 Tax=Pedobacter cryoconitis TaxID=188932 RepID=A0A7W8ZRI5_9SPHI|nr:aldo/keto reductase [Pedobacter cryoconitis]MBB5638877.1 aryl-alcohol dehydrogenase-like predicted oxidoreductase [Pedobacter cryoconitis]
MQYSKLGKSDLEISKIGFGCMSLSGNTKENELIIEKAVELGINYFDTADLYEHGENEVKIGNLLKLKRDQVIIATKVGNQHRADGNGWDWNPKKEYILSAVEGSLKRLQTDYIDLYQLHGGTMEDPIDETIEAFEILKQQGKIRHYGISSIRPNVIREYVQRSGIVSVMMQYSLLDRRPEEESLELLQKNGIGVLGRGSIAQGLLVDKPAASYLNWSAGEVAHAAEIVHSITGRNSSSAQTAIRFVLQNQALNSAVMGIRTQAQLEDIAAAVNFPKLTVQEMDLLLRVSPANYYLAHR